MTNKEINIKSLKGATSKTKENTKNSYFSKDISINTYLLLNSYANINPMDYLLDKTIEERIKSIREKIFFVFPEFDVSKINEEILENEIQKKKEISSINEIHSTKEIDII